MRSASGWAISFLGALSLAATAPMVAAKEGRPNTVAGVIFGVPVSMNNYAFAQRVADIFQRPSDTAKTPEEREREIWQNLILHFEAFRRGIQPTPQERTAWIDDLLRHQQLTVTSTGNPEAYRRWVRETLHEDVTLFENQAAYLLTIELLKRHVMDTLKVQVTEEELHDEFLNESHHIGGEMVTFSTKEEAEAFYARVKRRRSWDAMKQAGAFTVRPVSLMTLEAYIDLWSVPREQIYALHVMKLGAVGPPMPFGKQWCVFHLLEKRTGDLRDFPARRQDYEQQLRMRRKSQALAAWIDQFVASAELQVFVGEPRSSTPEREHDAARSGASQHD